MLDTNIVSELIRNPTGRAARRARTEADMISISVIVAAELRYGYAKKASPHLLRKLQDLLAAMPVLPFDAPADTAYGTIRAELEKVGQPIGANDLLIAAHAHTLGAIIVTANVSAFQRVAGLSVENWLV